MIPTDSPNGFEPDEIIGGITCDNGHNVYFRDFRFYCPKSNCKSLIRECPYCLNYLERGDDFGEYCQTAFCYYSNDYDRCGDMLELRIGNYRFQMDEMVLMDDPWSLDQMDIEEDLDAALERKIITNKERLELQLSLEKCIKSL